MPTLSTVRPFDDCPDPSTYDLNRSPIVRPVKLAALALSLLIVGGCASTDASPAEPEASDQAAASSPDAAADADAPGVRTQPAAEAASLLDDPDVIVLDIRTPEEVAEARLPADVVNLDFYEDDFAEQLAALDPDASYLMYCRSGNRSGTTRALLSELGFRDVVDIEGGIIDWAEAGLPITN